MPVIETPNGYKRAQSRALELSRPQIGNIEQTGQATLGTAMLEWELRDAESHRS